MKDAAEVIFDAIAPRGLGGALRVASACGAGAGRVWARAKARGGWFVANGRALRHQAVPSRELDFEISGAVAQLIYGDKFHDA